MQCYFIFLIPKTQPLIWFCYPCVCVCVHGWCTKQYWCLFILHHFERMIYCDRSGILYTKERVFAVRFGLWFELGPKWSKSKNRYFGNKSNHTAEWKADKIFLLLFIKNQKLANIFLNKNSCKLRPIKSYNCSCIYFMCSLSSFFLRPIRCTIRWHF